LAKIRLERAELLRTELAKVSLEMMKLTMIKAAKVSLEMMKLTMIKAAKVSLERSKALKTKVLITKVVKIRLEMKLTSIKAAKVSLERSKALKTKEETGIQIQIAEQRRRGRPQRLPSYSARTAALLSTAFPRRGTYTCSGRRRCRTCGNTARRH
jgi:hypothetical protein